MSTRKKRHASITSAKERESMTIVLGVDTDGTYIDAVKEFYQKA